MDDTIDSPKGGEKSALGGNPERCTREEDASTLGAGDAEGGGMDAKGGKGKVERVRHPTPSK